jgi:hypothetical protein
VSSGTLDVTVWLLHVVAPLSLHQKVAELDAVVGSNLTTRSYDVLLDIVNLSASVWNPVASRVLRSTAVSSQGL